MEKPNYGCGFARIKTTMVTDHILLSDTFSTTGRNNKKKYSSLVEFFTQSFNFIVDQMGLFYLGLL